MIKRLRTRIARDESGFTLMELMVSTVVGTIILLVAFNLLDSSVRAFGSSEARTDVSQRGRLSLDLIGQRLRSPVCVEPADSAVVSATGDSVRFTSDLSNTDGSTATRTAASSPPVQREIVFSGGNLTERILNPATGALIRSTVLVTGVTRVPRTAPATGGEPIFQYYALSAQTEPPTQRVANVSLGDPVLTADLKRVARVVVSFRLQPRGSTNTRDAADFVSEVYVRAINPASADGRINCTA